MPKLFLACGKKVHDALLDEHVMTHFLDFSLDMGSMDAVFSRKVQAYEGTDSLSWFSSQLIN